MLTITPFMREVLNLRKVEGSNFGRLFKLNDFRGYAGKISLNVCFYSKELSFASTLVKFFQGCRNDFLHGGPNSFFGTRATTETFGCFLPNSQFEEYFASCTQNFEQLVFFVGKTKSIFYCHYNE